MPASAVRSAPTLKYFSYSDASTIARTDGSSPSSLNAVASSPINSSAIELLPLRCMTSRATGPSRLMSTHSPISRTLGLEGEERDAARHLERGSRYVPRLVRAQESNRVRNVLRFARTLEHCAFHDPLVHVGVAHVESLGTDNARPYRIGSDVVAPAFKSCCLRECYDRHLRRRVAGLAESTHRAGDRGHEDDPAPFLLDHVRPDLLGAVGGAREADLDIAIPELVAHVLDLGCVVQRGGIVDKDVDASELVLDLFEHLSNLFAIGDVHLDRDRAPPHLADLLGGLIRVHPTLRGGVLSQR